MQPISLRLPPSLISALRTEAQSRGLDLASHIRSQLISTLTKPASTIDYTPRSL